MCILSPIRAGVAGEPARIPPKAMEAMRFFVGQWESDDFENGKKTGTSIDQRTWASGKHCVAMHGSVADKNGPWHAVGVAGWDAGKNALIEYWYGSQGLSAIVRYPLANMNGDTWDAACCFARADRKSEDRSCQLKKTPEGFEYVMRSQRGLREGYRPAFR